MNKSDPELADNLNWADCCDALHAEYWLRRMNEARLARRSAQLLRSADRDRYVAGAETPQAQEER
jgi:hypothetical protein